ncbi:MAG TPA: AraC family transcriptional regulator [Epulopiscium sp.]|nr:AraC family transcriptional regulator [Candidatus Epulonipiscium sp.]
MPTPYYESEKLPLSKSSVSLCNLSSSDQNNQDYHVAPHWHTSVELLYFLQDSATVCVGSNYYKVKSGDLIIINAGEVHSVSGYKGGTPTHFVLKILPELLYISQNDSFDANYLLPFTISGFTQHRLISKDHLHGSQVVPLMNEIYSEFNTKQFGYELSIQANINTIFLWILRYWQSQGMQIEQLFLQNSQDYTRLKTLFKYVQNHYHEPIHVADMADLCNMNYSYFSRYFKKLTGKTFVEYVNYIRLTEAEKLLLTTNLNVTQIAFATGFSSASYFIKIFKKQKGLSPNKMRNTY